MMWVSVLVVVVGVCIAVMIMQMPHRMIRLQNEADTRNARIADLDARFAQLSDMRTKTRVIFGEATTRIDVEFQDDETESLREMRSACEQLLVGLHETSPILERYLQNHIAILNYVLGGYDGAAHFIDALQLAMRDLDISRAAEHSSHPIAVMERRLATGGDIKMHEKVQ